MAYQRAYPSELYPQQSQPNPSSSPSSPTYFYVDPYVMMYLIAAVALVALTVVAAVAFTRR
jgi:hypothetical protein